MGVVILFRCPFKNYVNTYYEAVTKMYFVLNFKYA